MERHGIEIPVMNWSDPKLRLLRVSPQAHNSMAQYELLADACAALLAEER
jgi:hypothetical protein